MIHLSVSEILRKKEGDRIGGSEYKAVREGAEGLTRSSIQMENDEGEWRSYNFISYAEGKKGEDLIKIEFSDKMRPFFFDLKANYTSYSLIHVANLKHTYSIRIYELCKQYHPKIAEREIKIDRLRLLLTISDKKYANASAFRKRVLDPSVKEINEHSDIHLSYEMKKKGRKYDSVTFTISRNKRGKEGKPLPNVQDVTHEVVEGRLPQWINDAQYQILVKSFGQDRLQAGIEAVELKGDEVKSPRSYLMKGLQEGWFSASERSDTEKATKVIQAQKVDERLSIERQEAIVREFDAKRNEFLQGLEVDGDSIEMFVFQHLESEESYLRKIAGQLSRGERTEMAMKQVAVWMVNQNPGNYTEVELMLANSEIRAYAMKVLGHRWVG